MNDSPTVTRTLPAVLRERARAAPDEVFLRDVDGTVCTNAGFDALVREWMTLLHRSGVRPGDRVLTMLPTGADVIAVWMALARLGAVEVPVNTAHHSTLLAAVVEDTDAVLAVVDPRWTDRFDSLPAGAPTVLPSSARGEAPLAERSTEEVAGETTEHDPAEHDIATVVFTSGTTGRSKGVLIPWRQMHRSAVWCLPLDDAGPADHWYVPLPMFHVSGKISVYAAALTGAQVITRDGFSTSGFWPDVRRFGATTALLPGSAARYLESVPPRPDDADNPLRNVFVAPFPRDRDGFAARFGVRLTTAFNMTEVSCPIVSGWSLGPPGSCGRARPGVECRIVDEHDHEVPDGEVGELVVRTDSPWELMAGYLGAPEATAQAWRNLWFHTGDRCRRDAEGNYYFVDRAGDAIRRRGENVSSAEVEAVLSAHPDVAEAAVVGVPSEWGEHDIKAFVVPRDGRPLDPADVAAFAERELPRFMVPRFVVVLDDLPRTPTQRVQKAQLRAPAGEPAGREHDRGR